MTAFALLGLLFAVLSFIAPESLRFPERKPGYRFPHDTALLCLCLCAAFALKLHIIAVAAANVAHLPAFVRDLPMPAVQIGTMFNYVDVPETTVVELLAITETLILLVLSSLIHEDGASRRSTAWIIIAATILAGLALSSPATESIDLYAYVAQAQATPNAYHPDAIPFPGESSVFNRLWGLPLLPSPYGPAWIGLAKIVTAPMPTIFAKIIALRCLGMFAVLMCIGSLIALRTQRAGIALFALNPAIYDLFVCEGHNDLTAVCLILAAAAMHPRLPFAAIILAATAGLIKMPFILISVLAFTSEQRLHRRVITGLLTVILSCALSIIVGGAWYAWALHRIAAASWHHPLLLDIIPKVLLALFALGAVIAAFIHRSFRTGFAWSMPALGAVMLPQYLAWSLPYALLAKPGIQRVFLVTLPITTQLLSTPYMATPLFAVLRFSLAAFALIKITQTLRFSKSHEI